MLKFSHTRGGVGRKLFKIRLGDSQTYEVGDAVKVYVTGEADLAAAAYPLFGVIAGFVDANGVPLPDATVTAGTASGTSVRSVTTDASNSDEYYALIDYSRDTIYSAEVSGTLGTTNDSDLPGCRVDINSAGAEYGQLLETTATRTVGTPANFYSFGTDPEDSTRLMVTIAMSEIEGVKE